MHCCHPKWHLLGFFFTQNVPPSVGIDALRSGRCIDSVNALEIGVGSLGQYLLGVLGAAS